MRGEDKYRTPHSVINPHMMTVIVREFKYLLGLRLR